MSLVRGWLLLLGLCAALPGAETPAKLEPGRLQGLYDQAFSRYREKNYPAAILVWNEILRLDSSQKTATQMVSRVRMELMRRNRLKIKTLFGHIRQGSYAKALVDLQPLIEEDTTHPRYRALQTALEGLSALLPQAPDSTKAWRMAVRGLEGVLGPREDLRLTYDGLRYARELNASEERFKSLLNWLLEHHRELSGTDVVTPGMRFMEYKQFIAINQFYDGKYNLAVETLNGILALEPDDLLALKRLGSAYFSLGKKTQAREAWTRALRLSPDDAQLIKFLKKLDRPGRQKE